VVCFSPSWYCKCLDATCYYPDIHKTNLEIERYRFKQSCIFLTGCQWKASRNSPSGSSPLKSQRNRPVTFEVPISFAYLIFLPCSNSQAYGQLANVCEPRQVASSHAFPDLQVVEVNSLSYSQSPADALFSPLVRQTVLCTGALDDGRKHAPSELIFDFDC